nr:dihydrofolate reductase family protein [Paenibacillus elgii]
MKQQAGKNIVMIASPSLAQTFMHLGLIDEYRINVNPIVVGEENLSLKISRTESFLNLWKPKRLVLES